MSLLKETVRKDRTIVAMDCFYGNCSNFFYSNKKKALILESRPAEAHESMGTQYSEDSAVFYLEMLFRIVVQNRDRILTFWNSGTFHFSQILCNIK